MLDYTKGLTLHIQGLGISFHQAFMEMEERTQVYLPSVVDIPAISIQKIGGYIPQLVRIVYLDSDYQERQQAYMAKYSLGNLVCTPVKEEPIEHPFGQEMTLSNSPIGIILYLPSKELNRQGWLSLYQEGIPWSSKGYELKDLSNPLYLHT